MELALYCPVYGYYEKEGDIIGRAGDYYTSVSVGPLFGQLLACGFSSWFSELQQRDPVALRGTTGFELVEAGAHRGDLAKDILRWLKARRLDLFAQLAYSIVEPSNLRRSWQQKTLAEFASKVRWAESFSRLPEPGNYRIIFSNELVDAFPVHRLAWDAQTRTWFEWGVTLGNEGFTWARIAPAQMESLPSSATAVQLLDGLIHELTRSNELPGGEIAGLLDVLPDGFTIEVSPAAENWWRAAAGALGRGRLMTIDYGRTFAEFLRSEYARGTVRAYRNHHPVQQILVEPGGQDITADVNFTLLEVTGRTAGLKNAFFGNQAKFLTEIASQIWEGDCAFGDWTPECTRQFQTLTHPEHLGSRFKVLVQGSPST